MREYLTIKALNRGEVVDIGAGVLVEKDEGEIRPGDLYVAERNTGPHLLTAEVVNEENGFGCIFSTDRAYPFDLHECVKVREA